MSKAWRNPLLYAAWLAHRQRKFTVNLISGWQLIEASEEYQKRGHRSVRPKLAAAEIEAYAA